MKTFQSKTENILYSFIVDVGFPLNKAPVALSLSSTDFLNWWSRNSEYKFIKNKNISSMAQYLSIDESLIFQGNYNKELIRKRLFENPIEIPNQYANNSFSFLRSSAHIVKYITLLKGQHNADKILRKLNISPLIYTNLDNKINIKYFIDLLEILHQNGFMQDDLDTMASLILMGIQGSGLHKEYLKAKNYYDCYCTFAKTINQLESNFEYSADISRKQFRLTTHFYFDKHDKLVQNTSFDRLLRYRQLFLGWIPRLSNLHPLLPRTEVVATDNYIKEIFTVDLTQVDSNQPYLVLMQ